MSSLNSFTAHSHLKVSYYSFHPHENPKTAPEKKNHQLSPHWHFSKKELSFAITVLGFLHNLIQFTIILLGTLRRPGFLWPWLPDIPSPSKPTTFSPSLFPSDTPSPNLSISSQFPSWEHLCSQNSQVGCNGPHSIAVPGQFHPHSSLSATYGTLTPKLSFSPWLFTGTSNMYTYLLPEICNLVVTQIPHSSKGPTCLIISSKTYSL